MKRLRRHMLIIAILFWAVIPASGQMAGPTGVAVSKLAIHPLNPNTLYAAGGRQGIFKTVDGGLHWIAVNNGLNLSTAILTIAMDLRSPDTLYAGTEGSASTVAVYKTTERRKQLVRSQ